ncbi:hypothetical protein RHECNPAF_2530020 [Rhizobium etli CNPAF512]|nr:hypothetical protein RHECNPAF_2530020 [Rhizobium etli CNPAF512]
MSATPYSGLGCRAMVRHEITEVWFSGCGDRASLPQIVRA